MSIKRCSFTDATIAFTENPRKSIDKPLKLIGAFSKVTTYKLSLQRSMAFLYTSDNQLGDVIENRILCIIAKQTIKAPRDKVKNKPTKKPEFISGLKREFNIRKSIYH